jgi:hypothetical protein
MANQVKVEDLEVFRGFRVALLKFGQAAAQTLSGADSQISRTHSWLEGEQATYWHGQLRKRMEAVTAAREALRQKTLFRDASGRIPSAAQEEKTLAKCLAAVEQAEHKIEAVRKWLPKLEKETELYRAGVMRLGGDVTDTVPRAVELLDRLAARLEEYVQIAAPAARLPESAAASSESLARGGDALEEPPPVADAAAPAVAGDGQSAPTFGPPTDESGRKEGHDGADGK